MKHPHAELMLQYAQDATTTKEPWKLWQFKSKFEHVSCWRDVIGHPSWDEEYEYRHKPNLSEKGEILGVLNELYNDYKMLADSGDSGFWKLEDQVVGKKALDIIQKYEGYDFSEPTDEELLEFAKQAGLAYIDSRGRVTSPYREDTDIKDCVLDFARVLLSTK